MCVSSSYSEPCPPTNVQVSMACEQLTATVSWQQSDFAVGYVAYFDNQGGHSASCYGADTSTQCVVSGLMCGTEYNVWVKALGQQYNSSDSTVVSLTSGKQILSMQFRFCLFLWVSIHIHTDVFLSSMSAQRGRDRGGLYS